MIAAACGGGHSSIHVSSSAFAAGATIPRPYTCDGADISPPLHWSGVPAQSRELRTLGYRGPCPPSGEEAHHYVITVTAMSGGSTLASGSLTGSHARS